MRKAAVFISFVLGGCATAPAYRPPDVQVPSSFRATQDTVTARATQDTVTAAGARSARLTAAPAEEAGPIRLAYWQELGDTTLNRLMTEALRANLDAQAAEARLSGAQSAQVGAAFDLAPIVTFAGGYTRQRLSSASFPLGGGSFPDQDVWDGSFNASWELDVFGRLRNNYQAQGALVGEARESLRDVQVVLTAELARAYFELRGAQEQLAVARRNGENQRRTLEVTRQRLDAGRGTAFDTDRAQAQLSFTLASIPQLEARVAAAQHRIGVLIGRPPAEVTTELTAEAEWPTLPASVAVADPETLVRRRPDVAAAERRFAAEGAFVGAAKADYLPRLSLAGSAGLTASEFSSLGGDGTFRYAVGPVISWAAFDLGRVKAQVDISRAREAEARAQYEQTVLRALEEVETALISYRRARVRVERIQDAASASERAAALARLRFEGGVADFLQVLDAERTQLEAQDQLAQGRSEAATAYAALYEALGGTEPPADAGAGPR
jgi:outer membrane protein, multidrug efflux system